MISCKRSKIRRKYASEELFSDSITSQQVTAARESQKGRAISMTDELEAWETQEQAKRAAGHSTGGLLGGGIIASRREAEEHRLSDMLAEQARRDLVEAAMTALRTCTVDTERKGYLRTLHELHMTQAERADLMQLVRAQGIEQLLQEVEEKGASRKGQVYVAVRKYSILPGTAEEFLRRVQQGFVPLIRQA